MIDRRYEIIPSIGPVVFLSFERGKEKVPSDPLPQPDSLLSKCELGIGR